MDGSGGVAVSRALRVVLLDLLVERAEFGHGGNIEILTPLAERFPALEVWLLTPQFQSDEVGKRALIQPHLQPIRLAREDVPTWDEDYPFHSQPDASELTGLAPANSSEGWSIKNPKSRSETSTDGVASLSRIALPTTDARGMESWLAANSVDVVICSGSRRNVSQWEPWMEQAAALLRASITLALPTLGICFGHQLLAYALGGKVSRASSRTDTVCALQLNEIGREDPLFAGLSTPVCLFTHQEHVVDIPENLVHLCEVPHNRLASVRALGVRGEFLPVWGVQFHPEAAPKRIARSVRLGHITEEEARAFEREHDGAEILANFAEIVVAQTSVEP